MCPPAAATVCQPIFADQESLPMTFSAMSRSLLLAILAAQTASDLAGALGLSGGSTCWAQEDFDADSPAEHLQAFIHYTLIAKPDLAAGHAQKLIESGITDAELANIADNLSPNDLKRLNDALDRGLRVDSQRDLTGQLGQHIEQGRLDLARDPKRIEEAIQMLLGPERARYIGEQRLVAPGEYAVPALLKRIVEDPSEQVKIRCQQVVTKIGGPAVTPLGEALIHLGDRDGQRRICTMLSEINRPHAAPYLLSVANDSGADPATREAAQRAYTAVGGSSDDLPGEWTSVSAEYFRGVQSLLPHPEDAQNNIWSFNEFVGLTATQVPTPIYHDVMSMRLASRAVALDPNRTDAISLFVASNLNRENALPQGAADPIYGENPYTPAFYATVFGTDIAQQVLGMAIDAKDTPLVRDAIDALAKTTGGANLLAENDERRPLLEALNYPDRRVQYESALTLGKALPSQGFNNDHRVVPILASAVRSGDASYAVVIADDPENARIYQNRLEQAGFTVVGAAGDVAALRGAIGQAPGVDIAIVHQRTASASETAVRDLDANPSTVATPVLLLAARTDQQSLRQAFEGEQRILISDLTNDDQFFQARMNELLQRAAGGRMEQAEGEEYAIRSLEVLEDIAIAGAPVYNIADAEPSLIAALDAREGGLKMFVARILSLIDSDASQRKLFDASLAASGEEQVELLGYAADSVKRFGDRAEKRHVDALLDLVAKAEGETAEAAARVHGALNLPADAAVRLIPH
jgi:CheY-like chemotaxis protein